MTRRPDVAAPVAVGRVGGGVLMLSIGTFAVQAMSAVGQFVLAVWLQPLEYGYWATATAVLAVVSGLVNLGEVGGYLADPRASLRRASRSVLRINTVLAAVGFSVAAVYLWAGTQIVGMLVLLASLNLVILGEGNLLYAAFVKSGRRRVLILSQLVAAAARLSVGVLVAWATASAIAFALSMLAYTTVMVVALRMTVGRPTDPSPAVHPALPWRRRAAWAGQSVSQMMAGQADYLVISTLGNPVLLGLYFFSYQVTVALSAVLMVPLSRSALNDLANRDVRDREAVASRLLVYTLAAVGAVCAVMAVLMPVAAGLLPTAWRPAVPLVVLLLGSVPARFVAPVTDAVHMASDRWWLVTRMNTVDAIGTGLAGLAALTGQILLLGLAIVVWKVVMALFRIGSGLRSVGVGTRSAMVGMSTLYAFSLALAALDTARFAYIGPLVAAAVAAALLICSRPVARPVGKHRVGL